MSVHFLLYLRMDGLVVEGLEIVGPRRKLGGSCPPTCLLDLMDIGTVVFSLGTRVHRFYDGRQVEFIKRHDAVFATYRNKVIERLREAGLPDT